MANKTTRRAPAKRAAKKPAKAAKTTKAAKATKATKAAGAADTAKAAEPPPLNSDSEVHSVDARASVRDQLADDVARFLDGGGRVEEVPKNFRADPPRRPENNYGRGSI